MVWVNFSAWSLMAATTLGWEWPTFITADAAGKVDEFPALNVPDPGAQGPLCEIGRQIVGPLGHNRGPKPGQMVFSRSACHEPAPDMYVIDADYGEVVPQPAPCICTTDAKSARVRPRARLAMSTIVFGLLYGW